MEETFIVNDAKNAFDQSILLSKIYVTKQQRKQSHKVVAAKQLGKDLFQNFQGETDSETRAILCNILWNQYISVQINSY